MIRKPLSKCSAKGSLEILRRIQPSASESMLNRHGLLLHPKVQQTKKTELGVPFGSQ